MHHIKLWIMVFDYRCNYCILFWRQIKIPRIWACSVELYLIVQDIDLVSGCCQGRFFKTSGDNCSGYLKNKFCWADRLLSISNPQEMPQFLSLERLREQHCWEQTLKPQQPLGLPGNKLLPVRWYLVSWEELAEGPFGHTVPVGWDVSREKE